MDKERVKEVVKYILILLVIIIFIVGIFFGDLGSIYQ